MESSERTATNRIAAIPRARPRTFMVAGNAMMPAPIMVVDKLKTAPVNEAPLASWWEKLLLSDSAFLGINRGVFSSMMLTETASFLDFLDFFWVLVVMVQLKFWAAMESSKWISEAELLEITINAVFFVYYYY